MEATPYDAEFFNEKDPGSVQSARRILPIVIDLLGVKTALDVGCGTGTWTSVLLKRGVDAHGIDGDYIARESLHIPKDRFRPHDLLRIDDLMAGQKGRKRVDLVICMEVAEHLPASHARPLVRFLCGAGRSVLFSAAVPYQGGTDHINEQWHTYWRDLFDECGLEPFDLVRPAVWNDTTVEWWYAQNTLVYLQGGDADRFGLTEVDRPRLLNVVHPRMHTYYSEIFRSPPLRPDAKAQEPVEDVQQRREVAIDLPEVAAQSQEASARRRALLRAQSLIRRHKGS